MNTFLPYPSFVVSAMVLDDKRLGKQRLEALQLITAIEDDTDGWRNHPARLMWEGHTVALRAYFNIMAHEWRRRGFEHNMGVFELDPLWRLNRPWWCLPWGSCHELHASHRANLLRKDPDFYGQYLWAEDPSMPYYWPVTKTTGGQKR